MADLTLEKMLEYKEWLEKVKAEQAAKEFAQEFESAAKPLSGAAKKSRETALGKLFQSQIAKDIVSSASKPATASTAEEAAKVLLPEGPLVPVGKPYDLAELKRKAAETAARISSSGKLPGTINLPGPDEVKDLEPIRTGLPTVTKAAEEAIEAEFRIIPKTSLLEKVAPYAKAAGRNISSGLRGGALSAATGGLYDADQEEKQEEIRSGKKDTPVPGRPGYVFRGSEIVPADSKTPIAPDLTPSLFDIFKVALAPEETDTKNEALERVKKTWLGSKMHSGDEEKKGEEQSRLIKFGKALLGIEDSPISEVEKTPSDVAKTEELVKSAIAQAGGAGSSQMPSKKIDIDKELADANIRPSSTQEAQQPEEEEEEEEAPQKEAYKPSETQPTDFKEEEKNTLEKMLAGASSRDLEERKKYSELLNRALEKRDFSEFAAQLGRATAQIGAGLGGAISKTEAAKPVGEDIYRQMIASSDKYVSDLEKKKALEIEERRMDPRSAESMAARAIIADLGIKVPETANAAFLEKQFPAISTLMARRELIASQKAREEERKEERMALREQREEERAEKRSERQKERLEKQVERFGSNKELQEQRAALTQMEAAETKIGEMINDPSFSLDTYKKKEFKADIPGVSLPFIGRTKFYDTDARELDTSFQTILNQAIKSFAGKAVTKNELERIKTQYEGGKFANERDFLQAFADVKKAIRRGISTGEKAYTKEALEEYENRGGRVVSKEKIGEEKYALKKPSTESRSKGFISKKTLEDYAKKYNISLEKAKKELKDFTHEE